MSRESGRYAPTVPIIFGAIESVQHRLAISLAVLIAALAVSGPAYGLLTSARSLGRFCGGYETGDFAQWWLHQWSIDPDPTQGYNIHNVGNSTAKIVTRPVAQGRYAGEFQVFPTTGTHPNDRAEIVASQAQSGGYPGQAWWYGWRTYFPRPSQNWWHQGGDWNDITQFSSTDNVPSQMAIGIDAAHRRSPVIYTEGMPFRRKRILGSLRYGHWYHFLVHARWSSGSNGYVEMWLDGRKAVRRVYGATLRNQYSPASSDLTSPGMYLSQGIYRSAYRSTNTVIHDGFCRGASRRLAEPKAPPRHPLRVSVDGPGSSMRTSAFWWPPHSTTVNWVTPFVPLRGSILGVELYGGSQRGMPVPQFR
jgi:Polysaccharide lyase